MTEFPENEVEVLRDYFPKDLLNIVAQVRQELAGVTNLSGIDPTLSDKNKQANKVNAERRQLYDFFKSPAFDTSAQQLTNAYDFFAKRGFGHAITEINGIVFDPNLSRVKPAIDTAFRSEPMEYIEIFLEDTDEADPEYDGPKEIRQERTLAGYAGPTFTDYQTSCLWDFHDLVTGRHEFRFRTGLLKAESRFGLRQHKTAIKLYDDLLAQAEESADDDDF